MYRLWKVEGVKNVDTHPEKKLLLFFKIFYFTTWKIFYQSGWA